MKDTSHVDSSKLKQAAVLEILKAVTLEEIPEFDSAEDEAHFWKTHCLSQEVLDEIPGDDEQETA